MSEEPKLVCATCGCERPKRFFKRKREPALCGSCYYQVHKIKERAKEYGMGYCQRPGVKERVKEYASNYRQRPEAKELEKERVKKYGRSYRQRPEVKKLKNEREKDRVRQAASHYIKALIRHESKGILRSSDMSQGIIELKRQSLILKRTIKQKQKKDEQHTATDI